jgi:hypothetical protein
VVQEIPISAAETEWETAAFSLMQLGKFRHLAGRDLLAFFLPAGDYN